MPGRGTWTRCRFGWLALAVLACGCGARSGNVSGTVTYHGKPVADGTITFYDAGQRAWSSSTDGDGKYTVSKVPVGPARIVVMTPLPIEFKGMGGRPAGPAVAKTPPLPPKYGDPQT